jgi:hypothetical protein
MQGEHLITSRGVGPTKGFTINMMEIVEIALIHGAV